MVTFFDLTQIVWALGGLAIGGGVGAEFGIIGALGGGLSGGALGIYVGQLPWRMIIWRERRKLARCTAEEIRVQLRDPRCWTPNFLLRELQTREEDIYTDLPFVFDMMESEHEHRRTFGFAAIQSAYPELASFWTGYNPIHSHSACIEKVAEMRGRIAESKKGAFNVSTSKC